VNQLKLHVVRENQQIEEIYFETRRLINSGYTGRNQETIKRHIEELKKEGIPAPDSIPTVYEVITRLVYFDNEIEVVGEKTSGEAEFVLLCSGNEVYVGVGSDHTDRELEAVSIIKSKQVCPNIMSAYVWKLSDVRKEWDEMILRSWVKDDQGKKILYQEAPLSVIMTPEDLMAFIKDKSADKNLEGVAIYSGTIPLLTEKVNFNNYFEVELCSPKTAKRLHCSYQVHVLNYLRG
jgi:hypothetical protein